MRRRRWRVADRSSRADSSTPARPRSRRHSRRAWEDSWRRDAARRAPAAKAQARRAASRLSPSMMKMMMNGGAGSCSHPGAELAGCLPVPGEKFVQLVALGLTGDDALQHIDQIGLRIEFVELCRIDQRRKNCPALGATLAAAEQ